VQPQHSSPLAPAATIGAVSRADERPAAARIAAAYLRQYV